MKPHFQGQLDGLCGVYSVINSTKLIENINAWESMTLFNRIFALVEQRKRLSGILREGISSRDMAYIFREVVEQEYPIRRVKPFHRAGKVPLDLYWNEIQGFLAEDHRRAVIVVLEGWNWGHWTVIRKATEKTLFLFDSENQKRVRRRDCTTRKITRARRILLYPTRTYFLSRRE